MHFLTWHNPIIILLCIKMFSLKLGYICICSRGQALYNISLNISRYRSIQRSIAVYSDVEVKKPYHVWRLFTGENPDRFLPSKPISQENGCHMHFLAQNTLNLSSMRKQNLFERLHTPAENHRVWYGVRSGLYLTLKLDHWVWETAKLSLGWPPLNFS